MSTPKKISAALLIIAVLSITAVAGASYAAVRTQGAGSGGAVLNCPGGMTRLGHPLAEDMTIFELDPAVDIDIEYNIAQDYFLVEDIEMGAHAGTHLDAPGHFYENGRTVDDLRADEFVWPVYKMDVRGMTFNVGEIDDFGNSLEGQIDIDDIKAYEQLNGQIPRTGALVVLQTGAEPFWGAEVVAQDANGNATNIDDFFAFENAGFSAEAVQWLFDKRDIDGVGSDAYGPDAALDLNYGATDTALANDGVALVALANLDTVRVRGDIIIASTVALVNGSGFSTDPIACHGGGNSNANNGGGNSNGGGNGNNSGGTGNNGGNNGGNGN